jgi:hypothetical protein
MKDMDKKTYFLMFTLALFMNTGMVFGQCKVKVEALQGSYEGDCKKGLANGHGKAVGADTYEGEFKKGYPEGKGTYTWANGNVFAGEFKKGLKNGQGTLTLKETGTKTEGYWKDDIYIGLEKNPYKVFQKAPNVIKMRFVRSGEGQNIVFEYYKGGKLTTPGGMALREMEGTYGNVIKTGQRFTIQNVTFPFRAIVTSPFSMDFKITQKGNWKVLVDYR